MTPRIPNTFHFIWQGPDFPLVNQLAIESVLLRCARAEAVLWHTDDLTGQPGFEALKRYSGFRAEVLDAGVLRAQLAGTREGDGLAHAREIAATYQGLTEAAGRANVARLALLWRHGGVYLDLDTLTLTDFAPLREHEAFIGKERIIWPHGSRDRRLYRLVVGQLKGVVRNGCARWNAGLRAFRMIQGAYASEANNAVMGFTAGHPFLRRALERITTLSSEARTERFRLGTHLVQEVLRESDWSPTVTLLEPRVCYPLGPVICRHYFKPRGSVRRTAERVMGDAIVVHWYGSLAELGAFDAGAIEADAERTLFAHACSQVLTESRAYDPSEPVSAE